MYKNKITDAIYIYIRRILKHVVYISHKNPISRGNLG